MYPGYGEDKWGYPPPVPPGMPPAAPPFEPYVANPGPGYQRSRSKSPWKFGSAGPMPPGEVDRWTRPDKPWNERPDGRDGMKDHFGDRRNVADGWDPPRWDGADRWNQSDRRTHDDGGNKRDLADRREYGRKDTSDRNDRREPHYKKGDSKRLDEKPKENSEKVKQTKDRKDKGKTERENKENTDQDKREVKISKERTKKSAEKSDDDKRKKSTKESKIKDDKVIRKKDDDKDETKARVVKTEVKKKKIKVGKPLQDDSQADDVAQNMAKKKIPNVKSEKILEPKLRTVIKTRSPIDASDGSQSDNMPGKLKVKKVKKKRLKSVAETTTVGDVKEDQTDVALEFDLRQKLKKRSLSQSQEVSDDSSPTKRFKTENSEVRGSQIQVLSRMKPLPIKVSSSPGDEDVSVMPELSKWERDDYEEEEADSGPKTVTDKKPLPR